MGCGGVVKPCGSFPRDSSATLGMTGRVYCLTLAAVKLNNRKKLAAGN